MDIIAIQNSIGDLVFSVKGDPGKAVQLRKDCVPKGATEPLKHLSQDHIDRIVWLLTGGDVPPAFRIKVIGFRIDGYTLYEKGMVEREGVEPPSG